MKSGGYTIELENSEDRRFITMKLWNEMLELQLLHGSRPSKIFYGPSVVDTLLRGEHPELFPQDPSGSNWFENYVHPPFF